MNERERTDVLKCVYSYTCARTDIPFLCKARQQASYWYLDFSTKPHKNSHRSLRSLARLTLPILLQCARPMVLAEHERQRELGEGGYVSRKKTQNFHYFDWKIITRGV